MKTGIRQIKATINNNLDTLKDIYNVERIGVFGSVARGDNKYTSDVDVLVEFSLPIGMFKFIELEEFLTRAIGKKVDLVTKMALKPAIKQDILREVIYV